MPIAENPKIAKTYSAILAIRMMIGGVFLLEGIKKFIFAEQWGGGRFTRIGIPSPYPMAHFVGAVEIVCGLLVLFGLGTRFAAIPLLAVICTAIATTKIPILLKSGFWPMEAEARTDYAMLMGLISLVLAGSVGSSVDARSDGEKSR